MSLEERNQGGGDAIVPEFRADVYTGDADSYCVFNATEMPTAFGDNRPWAIRYLSQLHWYFPAWDGSQGHKAGAADGDQRPAGCTTPSVVPATDKDGGHLVFEFQAVDGEV